MEGYETNGLRLTVVVVGCLRSLTMQDRFPLRIGLSKRFLNGARRLAYDCATLGHLPFDWNKLPANEGDKVRASLSTNSIRLVRRLLKVTVLLTVSLP